MLDLALEGIRRPRGRCSRRRSASGAAGAPMDLFFGTGNAGEAARSCAAWWRGCPSAW